MKFRMKIRWPRACVGTDPQGFCSGILRANGEGFLACITNADCTALNDECPGMDCGTCSLTKPLPCFLDPIVGFGKADPQTPVGTALFCVPRTFNNTINAVAGLPGPARVTNQISSRTFCASDPGTEYMPGVGGCPP